MRIQKRLASRIFKASHKRVKFDNERLADIKEAITKTDVRHLIAEGAITRVQKRGVSRSRARHIQKQKIKGQRTGLGSRKGKASARLPKKRTWINKIRSQREFILMLKEKAFISSETYRDLYRKSKGGFFRSMRHINIYLTDNNLMLKKAKVNENKKEK